MRWAALYARSRQVPASLAALLVCTAVVWFVARDSWSSLAVSLALTFGVAVTATGLSGQDADLDRTAAIPWILRRGAHLLLIGVAAAAAVLVPYLWETGPVPLDVIVRDAAGLIGLAGISAVVFGGAYGWTLPLLAVAIALFTPPGSGAGTEIATWLFQPMEVVVATWTAVVFGVAGVASYAVFGNRR